MTEAQKFFKATEYQADAASDISHFGDLIKMRAVEDTDRAFIIEPDTAESVSFGELADKITSVLLFFAQNGFQKGDRAVTFFHNGIQGGLAFLSVISGDGVAIPVNPASTPREFFFLLGHAGVKWILTSGDTSLILSGLCAGNPEQQTSTIQFLGSTVMGLYLYRCASPGDGDKLPKDLALLLYTSGTTGIPKGVMLTHRNLLAECANIKHAHELNKEDTVLCLLPLYHINGLVVTLLTPLFTGLTVIMPPKFSASIFWNWVQDKQVVWFSAVPTIYSILLKRDIPHPSTFPNLKFVRSASSAMPEAVLHEIERRLGVPLIDSYGITEGGSQITSNPLPPRARKPGSVGLPFGNEIRIVQGDGKEAPRGVKGEVAVRGANITQGYYKNEKANKESFHGGWFRTGDIGFFDDEGYLFLSGRLKELINRAGEMISPREIDEILYQIPGVELAAAVGVPHELYGEEIVAFVKTRETGIVSEERVLSFCAEQLIAFKVPKRIYFIDNFPQGPSGKIQRLKLIDRYLDLPVCEQRI
jgi:acyl-CoA synthetase (AMP-forming)/AMP-acid ligase II